MTGTPHHDSSRAGQPAVGHDPASEPAVGRDPASVDVVRAEERLAVGRAVRVSGRAVLRKYVVTETVTTTVEVRREEVRLDVEPVGDDVLGTGGETAFGDRDVEMVLHREVPVVQLRVEPTERVRLHVDTVTEQVPVAADLRRERVDVESPDR